MRVRATGAKSLILGSLLTFCSPLVAHDALASVMTRSRPVSHLSAAHHVAIGGHHAVRIGLRGKIAARWRHAVRGGGISCVPFARSDSGIALVGNAWLWWDHAAGVYARGQVPEPGSVLAFQSNPSMRLGHVAVVSRIINAREVEIDHANWWGPGMRGGVAHNVPVVDVSEANDWSAVRVGLGRSGDFGSVYPTYGFIYDRPDNGVEVAAATAPSPQPTLNPAPRDLRPVAERPWQTVEEVAQAPAQGPAQATNQGSDSDTTQALSVGAIDRK
jgi:surface antigen